MGYAAKQQSSQYGYRTAIYNAPCRMTERFPKRRATPLPFAGALSALVDVLRNSGIEAHVRRATSTVRAFMPVISSPSARAEPRQLGPLAFARREPSPTEKAILRGNAHRQETGSQLQGTQPWPDIPPGTRSRAPSFERRHLFSAMKYESFGTALPERAGEAAHIVQAFTAPTNDAASDGSSCWAYHCVASTSRSASQKLPSLGSGPGYKVPSN